MSKILTCFLKRNRTALLVLFTMVCITTQAQVVSLSEKNAPLKEVFAKITRQTNMYFMGNADKLDQEEPVTIKAEREPLNQVLHRLLDDKGFTWSVKDNVITLSRPNAQNRKGSNVVNDSVIVIEGKVTDEKGIPLPGVSVAAKGTRQGGVTANDGSFMIRVRSSVSVLIFSMIGYETVEQHFDDTKGVSVILKGISNELTETVVKGYYKTTKELNTGSVGVLNGVDIAKQPISNPVAALEGRIPGLYVAQTSGVPGAGVKVNIRGLNSISNGTDPLYIVDGIPFDPKSLSQFINATGFQNVSPFNSIPINDIENITVLKDADATAIYGSRGANGVILITTKRGIAGKTKLDINIYNGAGKVTRMFDLMNTRQYLEMRHEAYVNDKRTPESYAYDVNGTWDTTRYTNWQKIMIGGTSNITNADMTLSGGNLSTQFLLGVGYRRETTVFPGDYVNQIASGNVNIHHESENKRLQVNFSTTYSNNNNRLPLADFTSYIFTAPDAPALYDSKGQLNWENYTFNNPFGLLRQKATAVTENLVSSLSFSYNIIAGIQFKTNVSYNSIKLNETNLTPFSSQNPVNAPYAEFIRNSAIGNNAIKNWIAEPQLNYSRSFGRHVFDALIAASFQSTSQKGFAQNASGFANDALIENPAFATIVTSSTSFSEYRYDAVFARLGYNYNGKYVINLTGRRDGSSRFGPGKQYGNFGAVGVAWIFSKESWVKENVRFLSLGKLRGSIGRTGNDQISDYRYLSTYGNAGAGYFGAPSLAPNKIANPYYAWETINKVEVALESGFLHDRILFNVNAYRNRTGNQLVGYSLPNVTGFNTVIANLPAVIENKGLEFSFISTNIQGKYLSWTTSANVTIPKNKLVSYPNLAASAYATTYAIGMPLTVRYSYRYTGIDSVTGLYTVADLDKDGAINSVKDRYPVFVGQKYFGGINNNITYKGFSLDIFFHFVKQTGARFLGPSMPGLLLGTGSNQLVEVLDRWQKKGDQATYQKFAVVTSKNQTAFNRFSQSDGRIVDASYIRLKNVAISWQMPDKWVKAIHVNNVRIYAQGQNLFTITKFDGLDPENQTVNAPALPTLRIYTAGIQASL